MNCTAGDVIARDIACRWLSSAQIDFDVATLPQYGSGIVFGDANPQVYTHVLFVCGPFRRTQFVESFLQPFAHCRFIGLNLSMLTELEHWNPFDVLFERDSSREARPDITFAAELHPVPVAGVVLVHDQPQYGKRAMHRQARQAIERLCERHPFATVRIDTCLDGNSGGLRTAAQIESLIARMDFVITTRLHGMVLALKNGVPPLVIDPIAGGAKISRQAAVVGWPAILRTDELTDSKLDDALSYCQSPQAQADAQVCGARSREAIERQRGEFLQQLLAIEPAAVV